MFILLSLLGYASEAVCMFLFLLGLVGLFVFMEYFGAENAAWREIEKDRIEVK